MEKKETTEKTFIILTLNDKDKEKYSDDELLVSEVTIGKPPIILFL